MLFASRGMGGVLGACGVMQWARFILPRSLLRRLRPRFLLWESRGDLCTTVALQPRMRFRGLWQSSCFAMRGGGISCEAACLVA